DQEALGEHVAADYRLGCVVSRLGKLYLVTMLEMDEAVALHPSQGRERRRRSHTKPLFDPRQDRRLALTPQYQDCLKIVLNCLRWMIAHRRMMIHGQIVGACAEGRQRQWQ